MGRPETIEETAELVDAGGHGIAVRVDHLVPAEVEALVARIDEEQGALHILVNHIWDATAMEWDATLGESTLDLGLRTLRLAIDTHAITAHFALPLMIRTPGGLVVEGPTGTAEYNATNYRVSFFYDMAKAANLRMAFALAHLARRDRTGAALRHLGEPHVRRARRRRTGGRPRRRPLERAVAVERRPREGLRLHRRRRQQPRRVALPPRGAGPR